MTYSPSILVKRSPAGHGRDPDRVQLSLLEFDPPTVEKLRVKRVLGGHQSYQVREGNATGRYVKNPAHGWIEFHMVKRQRKNGDIWETKQAWLHWEEPGGRKRSKYIPKAKFADVEESIYGRRAPLDETLKLLEKKE